MLGTDKRFRKEYVAPRGGKFAIVTDQMGMYLIEMANGGVRPNICKGRFTSFRATESILKDYFEKNPEVTPRDLKKDK